MWVLEVESESMSLHLVQGEWSLGRSGNVFNFPKDKSISRNHAEFLVGGILDLENVAELPSFVLVDKKSRFGTYLNDVQISPNTPMPLRAGDKVSFGAKTTILRVRYFKMVLTSRIQKMNRKMLLDGCKAIGMHVVTAAVEDVNYCITDPGKFVATEKVLWAMAHNHPIVASEWVQAILRRKSMAEELPPCDKFLPQHDASSSSSTEERHQPSYASDPRRFSLFSNYLVVFLTSSSMEALVPVMGGQVYAAYNAPDNDEQLVEHLGKSTKDHVLIVYPIGTSGGDGGASEKQQLPPSVPQTKQTSSSLQSRPWVVGHPSEWNNPALLRRVQRLHAAHLAYILHQELAASIIFTKPPTTMTDETVSQMLLQHASSERFEADDDTNQSVDETPLRLGHVPQPVELPSGAPLSTSDGTTTPAANTTRSMDLPVVERSTFNLANATASDALDQQHTPHWRRKPFKRLYGDRQPRADPPTHDEADAACIGATVVYDTLVVRRSSPHDEEGDGMAHVRYLPRYAAALPSPLPSSASTHAKTFRKAHVVTMSSRRRLITHFTNVVPVNLERRREIAKEDDELEARERIAEALFVSAMPGPNKIRKRR
ncbi:hypothetical protein DYB30_002144 [Aphanomyces astaci]|uniref:FHA domain-containing protein n=2 Tax=Aphanomyces astaci TaxID=112090 RepID=A0A397FGJ8_APHAT|nr:hypothetical protein DYB30_002144 [Aphanomyces astaci]RHY82684.1 hypothetical protein DYB26_005376 [Aphanomyces astaci]RHZ32256.1 hypothetical protein DYB31_003616 [Aphanomyces astaci]